MTPESIVVFIIILGVLVAFHEWGHLVVAKLFGMKVEEFALGFGPRLVRLFKRRETEYNVRAVPLGGFVRITGMEPGEEDVPDGFQSKPIWQRALVIFAGPLFSFILAVLVFELIGIVWGYPTGATLNRVLQVSPHSVASTIGLRAGDNLKEINGQRITNGTQMVDIIHARPGKDVVLLVDRDGKLSTKKAVPRWQIDYLAAAWSFMHGDRAKVEDVTEKSPAEKAGIKTDDILISFNGKPIVGGPALDSAIKANGMREATLVLRRGDKNVTVHPTPAVRTVDFAGAEWYFPEAEVGKVIVKTSPFKFGDDLLSVNGKKIHSGEELLAALRSARKADVEIKRPDAKEPVHVSVAPGQVTSAISSSQGLLGFMPQYAFTKMGFTKSLEAGWSGTRRLVAAIFESLSPAKIGKSVGGPILIARQTGITVAQGPYYVVQLAGMLSLSLAIINFFPIPIFDGGQLAILGIEAIRRRRLTREQMQWVQMAGLAIIGALILTIFFSDIHQWVGGQLPQ